MAIDDLVVLSHYPDGLDLGDYDSLALGDVVGGEDQTLIRSLSRFS